MRNAPSVDDHRVTLTSYQPCHRQWSSWATQWEQGHVAVESSEPAKGAGCTYFQGRAPPHLLFTAF